MRKFLNAWLTSVIIYACVIAFLGLLAGCVWLLVSGHWIVGGITIFLFMTIVSTLMALDVGM